MVKHTLLQSSQMISLGVTVLSGSMESAGQLRERACRLPQRHGSANTNGLVASTSYLKRNGSADGSERVGNDGSDVGW